MHHRVLTVATTFLTLGLVFACTVTTENPDRGGNTSSGGTSSGSNNDDGGSSGSKDGGSGKGDVAECKAKPDIDTCEDCCGLSDAILDVYDEAYFTCACEQACASECAEFCADDSNEPSDACETCLNADTTNDVCEPKIEEACQNDSACKAFDACAEEACADKLDDPGDGDD